MSLQALVACLAQKKGQINGKKAFQKYMYFLDAKGIPNPLTFRIHHYGPYSYELDYQTDNLELIGAIQVSTSSYGGGFLITPGSNAQKLIDESKDFLDKYENKIDEVLEVLPDKARDLELWSTVHFVAKSMANYFGGATKQKVVAAVKEIKKEKFCEEEIAKAFDSLIDNKLLILDSRQA